MLELPGIVITLNLLLTEDSLFYRNIFSSSPRRFTRGLASTPLPAKSMSLPSIATSSWTSTVSTAMRTASAPPKLCCRTSETTQVRFAFEFLPDFGEARRRVMITLSNDSYSGSCIGIYAGIRITHRNLFVWGCDSNNRIIFIFIFG